MLQLRPPVERVQVNKPMASDLTRTGHSHGGNGFEGTAFLLDQCKDKDLADPTDPGHGVDLTAMASGFARDYRREKAESKGVGASGPGALPGVRHPVFKGKPVNYDPRERFIAEVMAERGDDNIFHDYYRAPVQALYEGVSPYVFRVNVDAVIAALLPALLWQDCPSGALSERDLETAAFTVFPYGRMIGRAAEIDDHLNRGRNVDTRTPASQCRFVC